MVAAVVGSGHLSPWSESVEVLGMVVFFSLDVSCEKPNLWHTVINIFWPEVGPASKGNSGWFWPFVSSLLQVGKSTRIHHSTKHWQRFHANRNSKAECWRTVGLNITLECAKRRTTHKVKFVSELGNSWFFVSTLSFLASFVSARHGQYFVYFKNTVVAHVKQHTCCRLETNLILLPWRLVIPNGRRQKGRSLVIRTQMLSPLVWCWSNRKSREKIKRFHAGKTQSSHQVWTEARAPHTTLIVIFIPKNCWYLTVKTRSRDSLGFVSWIVFWRIMSGIFAHLLRGSNELTFAFQWCFWEKSSEMRYGFVTVKNMKLAKGMNTNCAKSHSLREHLF